MAEQDETERDDAPASASKDKGERAEASARGEGSVLGPLGGILQGNS